MDGSQKLPQRILGTLRDNLAAGRACPGLCLAVAAWMRYVGGVDEKGDADRREATRWRPGCRRCPNGGARTPSKVAALLAVREIFPAQLAGQIARAGDASLCKPLVAKGARRAVRRIVP